MDFIVILMKIKSTHPLFQYGIKAYKDQEVEVNDKLAKEIIKNGHATEVKKNTKK